MMDWRLRRGRAEDEDSARDVDRALADLSQTHSDSDQSASDLDATASESDRAAALRDQIGADADQRASESDQASLDRELEVGPPPSVAEERAHEHAREDRADATQQREATQLSRTNAELERISADTQRFETSALRDEVAIERDRAADLRERAAERSDAALLAAHPENLELGTVLAANSEMRDRAMVDRRRAAVDRQRAAEDRRTAAAAQRQARIDVQVAQMDGLTGVHARQLGVATLRGEIDRCRRTNVSFVLAFVRVDGLGRLTEQQGQPVSDSLVTAVVHALREKLRSYDPVVRVSGDAFLCGLPGTEPEAAEQRVAEIRSTVRRGHPPGTISVGFAVLDDADSLASLIDRAEANMQLDHRQHDER